MLSKIRNRIKYNLNTQNAKELFFVYGSSTIKLGLGFVINILLAKELLAYNYGVFALIVNFFLTISGLADFGLSHSTIKLYSERKINDTLRADLLLRGMFFVRVFLSLITAALTIIWVIFFSQSYFDKSTDFSLLLVASVLIFFDSIFNYFLSQLQAIRKVLKYGISNFSFNTIRLILISIFLLLGILNVSTAILSFLIATIVCLFICLYDESIFKFEGVIDELKKSFKEVLFWGKWLMLTTFANALFVKLDIILLGYFDIDKSLIGNYGLALSFAFVLGFFSQTTQILFMPKASQIKSSSELKRYLKNALKLNILFSVGIFFALIIGYFSVQLIFSKQYVFASEIFLILCSSYAFGLLTIPYVLLNFAINKPQISLVNNLIGIVVLIISTSILIPVYGIYGCAFSVLISKIAADLFSLVLIFYFTRKTFYSSGIKFAN